MHFWIFHIHGVLNLHPSITTLHISFSEKTFVLGYTWSGWSKQPSVSLQGFHLDAFSKFVCCAHYNSHLLCFSVDMWTENNRRMVCFCVRSWCGACLSLAVRASLHLSVKQYDCGIELWPVSKWSPHVCASQSAYFCPKNWCVSRVSWVMMMNRWISQGSMNVLKPSRDTPSPVSARSL